MKAFIISFPCFVVFCLFEKAKFKENVIPNPKKGNDFSKGRGHYLILQEK